MTPLITSAVMHFGEMGSRWGFNRTVGQILALIVLNEEPISAQEIADALNISRGNTSMGLKELQSWRLVKQHHVPGERKEFWDTSIGFSKAKTVKKSPKSNNIKLKFC